MPHEIAGITECLLCGRKFAGPQAIVIGQPRAVALLEKLANHLETAHGQQNEAIALLSLQYVGLLRMMNFKTNDPELKNEVDKLRWAINQQTIAARISDETIQTKTQNTASKIVDTFFGVMQMEADRTNESVADYIALMKPAMIADIQKALSELVTGMRDVMQEPNKYAVNLVGAPKREGSDPNSSLIVT
jgi:hypothetical protein